MLINLDRCPVTGFSDKSIVPLLSPWSGMGSSTVYPSSVRKLLYQMPWLEVSVMAMYSIWMVFLATVFCFHKDQLIALFVVRTHSWRWSGSHQPDQPDWNLYSHRGLLLWCHHSIGMCPLFLLGKKGHTVPGVDDWVRDLLHTVPNMIQQMKCLGEC